MSTSQPSQPQPERLEQIVAYLDGELSPEESAQVERRLATDEGFRQQLQSFDRAWTALDALPAATVNDDFSKTTMELVVDAANRKVIEKTQAMPVLRQQKLLVTALVIVGSALLGAATFRLRWENRNEMLLADLPVIHFVDVYSQFRDINFLVQLDHAMREDVWVAEAKEEVLASEVEQFKMVSSDQISRETWVEQLDPDQRDSLRARYNRFRSFSPDEKDRLRQLHQQLMSAENPERLQETMLQYQMWLNTLEPGEQFELRKMPTTERVERVSWLTQSEQGDPELVLTREEMGGLSSALKPHVDDAKRRVHSQLTPGQQERLKHMTGLEKQLSYLAWTSRRERARSINRIFPVISEALPPEKRDRFDQLQPRAKVAQMFAWKKQILEAFGNLEARSSQRRGPREVSQQELEKFFDEGVDAGTKEELLAMPRDKMQQELRRMYFGTWPRRGWGMMPGERGDHPRRGGPPPRRENLPDGGRRPQFRPGDRREPPDFDQPRGQREERRRRGFRSPIDAPQDQGPSGG